MPKKRAPKKQADNIDINRMVGTRGIMHHITLDEIQSGAPGRQIKPRLRKSSKNAEKEGPSARAKRMPSTSKPPRNRSGFVASTRIDKVCLQAFVPVETREQFHDLAAMANLTTGEFLAQVIDNVVKRGFSPEVKAEITGHLHQAETARRQILSNILDAPRKNTPTP